MNIARYLAAAAARRPDRPGVVMEACRTISYAEFDARADRLASAMLGPAMGLRPGDRVLVRSTNRPEVLEVMFACFKAGLVLVPVHYGLRPAEVDQILATSDPALVFRDSRLPDVDHLETTRDGLGRRVITVGEPGEHGDYDSLMARGSDAHVETDVESHHPAWMFFTSGTTGQPKGAVLTHGSLEALIVGFLANIDNAADGDVFLHAGPLSHASGLCSLYQVARGNTHVILPSGAFSADHVVDLMRDHAVTTTFMVPTAMGILLEAAERRPTDLRSLRTLIYGGAPMPSPVVARALRILGPILVQLYGQGEAPHVLSVLTKSEHRLPADGAGGGRLGSAGRPCVGVDLRIVDANDDVVQRGSIGEIVVRGPIVMREYWSDPAATADTLRGGWLHTGDLGYLDDEGYLFITGRKKELIITGGMNVYSREVEDVIGAHPAVREVAVVGIPDPKWGEAVKAFIVLRDGHSIGADDIIAYCRDRLAYYKKPKSVEFLASLPRGATGKILKRALVTHALSGGRS